MPSHGKADPSLPMTPLLYIIPNREATINDKDAPWITPEVKQAIKKNHRVYSKWKRDGKPDAGKAVLKTVNEETDRKIETAKSNYYQDLENKLSNSKNDNVFWSVVNRLVGRNKKMTNIPPLLEHGAFVTSFQEKADLFNKYFANQCNPIDNGSVLPELHASVNKLSDINVDISQISSIIGKLHSKKAHGHDDIAINMLKIAKDEVSIPLKLIFDKCISTGKYPSEWQMFNLFIRKIAVKTKQTIDQSLCCQFVVKYLRKYYLILFTTI